MSTKKVQLPKTAPAYAKLVRAAIHSRKKEGFAVETFGVSGFAGRTWGWELEDLVGLPMHSRFFTCPWDAIVLEVRDWRRRRGSRRLFTQLIPKGLAPERLSTTSCSVRKPGG